MKLNYKNTVLVGLAFALIMAFWTAYDFLVPLMINRSFGMSDAARGAIMGIDNLLALVMLPMFGMLSDKTKGKWGRRTPYIVIGTVISVVAIIFLPIIENVQIKKVETALASTTQSEFYEFGKSEFFGVEGDLEKSFVEYLNVNGLDDTPESRATIFGDIAEFRLNEDGKEISNEDYIKLVKPLKSYWIYENVTQQNTSTLVLFMASLLVILIAMATFRSPAVALMSDVTPKPLRSQANAIINLMGGVGGGLGMIAYTILLATVAKGEYSSYISIWYAIGIIMLVLVAIFMWKVREPKLLDYREQECKKYGVIENEEEEAAAEGIDVASLSKGKMISFFLLLGSIFMWFMGYNAILSNLSIYSIEQLGFSPSSAGMITMVSYAISALAFIPVGFIASKYGRKKSILAGFVLAIIAFIVAYFITPDIKMLFAVAWIIAGFGLIIVNVNTLPMVVEMCTGQDIGKYTGWYYTATMSAQAITPLLCGLFMKGRREVMFLYAVFFIALAFIIMMFVKHGDSKPLKKVNAIESLDIEE